MKFSRFSSWLASLAILTTAHISHAQTTWNTATLSWTTPGDDGTVGTASGFDLRYSTAPITSSNFGSATRWLLTPVPGPPGSRQSATVTGLLPNTTYYFAIKTADDVPNWSDISNVVTRTTSTAPDTLRPAPVAVAVSAVTDTTATLSWQAVGDDSLTGRAATYDLRYSTSPITSANWAAANQVDNEPPPGAPGSTMSYAVRSLSRQVTYYFAVRAIDDAGHLSAMSNVPNVTTPDTMAPTAIRDLAVGFVWFGWHSSAVIPSRSGRVPRP